MTAFRYVNQFIVNIGISMLITSTKKLILFRKFALLSHTETRKSDIKYPLPCLCEKTNLFFPKVAFT